MNDGFLSHVTCHTHYLFIYFDSDLHHFNAIWFDSFVIFDYKYKVYGTDQGFWKSFSVNCITFSF